MGSYAWIISLLLINVIINGIQGNCGSQLSSELGLSLNQVDDLQVQYGGSVVACGQNIDLGIVEEQPSITFPNPEYGKFFTLIMFDPDAPSPSHPMYAPWLHWLKIDIQLDEDGGVRRGREVVGYYPPSPPSGTGFHRYVVLLLEGKINGRVQVPSRPKFDVVGFVRSHGLKPVGMMYFKAKRGEMVDGEEQRTYLS